jgi:hypothetical protein
MAFFAGAGFGRDGAFQRNRGDEQPAPETGVNGMHDCRRLDVNRTGDTLKAGSLPMKPLVVCGLFVLFTSGLFAQRRANTVGTNAGYGNVVFPGGRPPITTPFTQTNSSFTTSLGNVVAGRPVFNGAVRRNANTGAIVYVPYNYPVYGGGGYYGGYYGGYGDAGTPTQPSPNITVIYPPQQPMPMMMVGPQGQLPPGGQVREYGPADQNAPEAAQAQPEATYYLLAFKDHSIYSAAGYWVDGDTLHYLTAGNVHNQVSLSLVDRDLTTQLNKGRGVQVNLPAASR